MKFHEAHRPLDRFFFRLQLKLREAANNFLRFGKRPVGHGQFAFGYPDVSALRNWREAAAADHGAGFDIFFGEDGNGVHQFLGRKPLLLGVLDHHHESHGNSSFVLHF